MNTKDRLVRAAAGLLDAGGEGAVTLRAVAERVGVSHNAPYRHFKHRNALLAAVAEQDLRSLHDIFRTARRMAAAGPALKSATKAVIDYAREHPARYRLLFSDPNIAAPGGGAEDAAFEAFSSFAALVERFQAEASLPKVETMKLAGLIYAALHGAIDIELGGRAKEQKGLGDIEETIDLLLGLLKEAGPPLA